MSVSIIIEDNPISRCYIKILKDHKIKIENLIYLSDSSFLPNFIKLRMKFNKNNFWPLKFLKNKEFQYLINQIEEFFDFKRGFCQEMYRFENINYISDNIIISKSQKINSIENIDLIKSMKEKIFINTGKQILKEILDINKKFIHIHPGDLPYTRGADASLWQLKNFGNYAVSCFYINKELDNGEIIFKQKINFKTLKLDNFSNYEISEIYRLWYSFFDPLLRGSLFRKLLDSNKISLEKLSYKPENNKKDLKNNYFSFMDDDQKKQIFEFIFN